MAGPFKLKNKEERKDFFKNNTELVDLRPNDKNIDLDKGGDQPSKKKRIWSIIKCKPW